MTKTQITLGSTVVDGKGRKYVARQIQPVKVHEVIDGVLCEVTRDYITLWSDGWFDPETGFEDIQFVTQ